jgi:hypothetical protein
VRRSRKLVAAGFAAGVLVGIAIWSVQMTRWRRELFSRHPLKRLAALGYLSGHPGVETAQLLTEYARWESKPALRRRAERLLHRMKGALV